MDDRTKNLEDALAEVCAASAAQLAGLGKGKEPSPRLLAAYGKANELLGRDPSRDPNDRQAALDAEIAELRAELAKRLSA